ncbi:MAG: UDP-4-amino-4,6-dideoxy-N-acetyl-beta-L-altrosamine N-acetyltransferase [Sulfuricurvum sp.]|nr:UDP-4-amino-4,6-dideoxy-N-acetyl-beta-L-altrosamine N-acetyltransferase [Sulfuricurvum sp.]
MIELKNFVDLNAEERKMVLTWRNHDSIRTHMYTDEPIGEKEHETFINSLSGRNNKQYFVVYKNHAPIGVIDLTEITSESASLGLYANPFSDRKGIGRIILRALIRYAFETFHLSTLHLECFEENEKAQALYKKFDFKEIKRMIRYERPIICMELNREHSAS